MVESKVPNRRLRELAKACDDARLSGDPEAIDKAVTKHKDYGDLCHQQAGIFSLLLEFLISVEDS